MRRKGEGKGERGEEGKDKRNFNMEKKRRGHTGRKIVLMKKFFILMR